MRWWRVHDGAQCLGLILVLAAGLTGQSRPADPAASFWIQELFGVAHPRQIIDFDSEKRIDAGNCYMIGPQGKEVPFQVLHDGKIAVEADLPAEGRRGWKLYAGRAAQSFRGGIEITERADVFEVTNGLTGVRIIREGHPNLAPIQGILYRDGKWTATGPNSLQLSGKPTGMTVRFLEKGPLKVVVEVSYTLQRADLVYGGKLLIPAGEGFYRSRIEVQADQPSILVEDDTDTDVRYTLNVFEGLRPDQARYRGHHSSSIANGREPDGRQYRMGHERGSMDAIRDLQYTTASPSSYTSSAPYIRRMAVWDPWVYDSGWYWQLYNSKAGGESNLLGIFAGRASEAIGAAHNGPGIFTAPGGAQSDPQAGITFECNRRAPDARVYPRVRIAWGVFVGTKGADLGDPYEVQNIARQMNLHGGINLNKVHRHETSFPDPAAGYRPLYMDGKTTAKIIQRVRADDSYYRLLYAAEPGARPLLDMWRDGSGRKLKAVVDGIEKTAADLLNAMVNGDGIYDFRFHYWHGGLEMSRQAVWINSVLTSDEATAEDRASVKRAAVLFANVLWDLDFVPMFDGHGLNMGTANMPVQQGEYRDLYALLLADHPMMRERVATARANALANLHATVNEAGAHMAGTHYIGASMGPLLSTLQQLQTAGIADAFRDEPRLAAFGEFYLNLLTPPEVRFGGYRKLISIGDGSTESSELFGQLGTAFAADNPSLSSRLMAAWMQSGAPHSGFHGSTILKIDDTLPPENAHLGNANFAGWYSVLRNGWATRNETAAWLIDGGFYRDHTHQDNGTMVMYALGAPLSIDWGSMYSPQTAGAYMHSVPVLESGLGFAWDTQNPPLDGGGRRWQHATQQAFESFRASGHVRADYEGEKGLHWTRSVYSIHPDESNPMLVIHDGFTGAGAGASKIWTLNLMANGTVESPQGPVAEGGTAMPLPAGLNRFGFQGQWAIDWDLYSLSSAATQALIGSWSHNWHSGREQGEFARANGRPFEEKQYIFRAKIGDDFTVLLLPRRKGQAERATVTADAAGRIHVAQGNATTVFDGHCYSYRAEPKTIVTAFDTAGCNGFGIEVQGGPAEVAMDAASVAITAHGGAGKRRVRWPGGQQVMDYAGGVAVTVVVGRTAEAPGSIN